MVVKTLRSCGTKPMPLCTRSCGLSPVMSSSPRRTAPARNAIMPKIAFIAVDLPAPLGPTMTATSPCSAWIEQLRMMSAPP